MNLKPFRPPLHLLLVLLILSLLILFHLIHILILKPKALHFNFQLFLLDFLLDFSLHHDFLICFTFYLRFILKIKMSFPSIFYLIPVVSFYLVKTTLYQDLIFLSFLLHQIPCRYIC
jgi:hypothetical protein